MTLIEAEKMFGLPHSILEKYTKFGFIRESDIEEDYRDADFNKLGLIDTLINAGFSTEEIKKYLSLTENEGTDEQKKDMLKKQRREILKDIHKKQQLLDTLDYIIWDIKNNEE